MKRIYKEPPAIRSWLRRHWIQGSLASGLILGLAATPTLASWTDSEFAGGTFIASTFDTESNVNGAGYAGNHTSTGPTVSFTLPGFGPGDTRFYSVLIRTTPGSVAGTTTLNGATLSGPDAATLGAAFVYRVIRTTATCNSFAFSGTPTFVVGSASVQRPLTSGQEIGVVNPLAAATVSLPGTPTGFCFELTLPSSAPSSLQNKTANAAWNFVATSN